jgi:predicted RNA-binding Zn-ribbon protein involved in translation (DUF1610 family)
MDEIHYVNAKHLCPRCGSEELLRLKARLKTEDSDKPADSDAAI